jgi:hypothetical protein
MIVRDTVTQNQSNNYYVQREYHFGEILFLVCVELSLLLVKTEQQQQQQEEEAHPPNTLPEEEQEVIIKKRIINNTYSW